MTFPANIAALAARIGNEIKALRESPPGASLITGRAWTRLRRGQDWVSLDGSDSLAGDDAIPEIDWRVPGIPIPAGRTLKALYLTGRVDDDDVGDVDLYVTLRRPDPPGLWLTGFDSDSDLIDLPVYQGAWLGGEPPSRHHGRAIPLNTLVTQPSHLHIFARAADRPRRNRDLICTWTLSIT